MAVIGTFINIFFFGRNFDFSTMLWHYPNFAVRISGDSMEPEFHDGEYALVRTQPQIERGRIGIFTVNSDGYIKKTRSRRAYFFKSWIW